ncbi:unnamed protein product [Ambrosiozyma monospora]|uniref:Unnamed protein product n=1 Tax=Ambrosiozyma monospora TaxID=43982 RepID=A0A9W6YSY5_AMBMO|nr:unnamed protein product [Ambrosiozyma monospora]
MMSARLLPTLRLATRAAVRRNMMAVPKIATASSLARFSTTVMRTNEATSKLKTILTAESDFEHKDAFGLDDVYNNWLKSSGFEIVKTDNKVLAELIKKNGDETLHLYFDVQRITQIGYQMKQFQEDFENETEDGEMLREELSEASIVELNFVVEKAGKAVGFDLLLNLVSNQFSVAGVTNFSDASIALSDNYDAVAKRDVKYSGPEFSNLAEELQESITEYLSSRGVDTGLAEFIVAYSSVKENNEYITWLDQLKGFF